MNKKSQKEFESNKKKLMFWIAFLRLSRSYTIAHAYKRGFRSFDRAKKEIPDIEKVIETYDKFGYVWKNPLEWFDENMFEIHSTFAGAATPKIVSILSSDKSDKKSEIETELNNFLYKDWAAGAHETTLLVSIPLKIKKNNLHEFLKNALEQLEIDAGDEKQCQSQPKKFELTNEIVRMDALEKAYNLMMMKAANPLTPNWELAERLGLCLESVKVIKQELQDKAEGKETDPYANPDGTNHHQSVDAVIWRYVRLAYVLAENAARGEFPKTLREKKEEKEKRLKEGKKKYVKLEPRFKYPYLQRKVKYFKGQIESRGMEHKYANEFLVPEAKINRKWVPDSRAKEPPMVDAAHENFLKHRRIYKPLPPMDDEEI